MIDFSPFQYTGYWIEGQLEWGSCLKTDLHKIVKKGNEAGKNVYHMVYDYATTDTSNPYKIGDLYHDFDSADNIEQARVDCLRIADILYEKYHLGYNQMQLGFSGCKGFYLIVPKEAFLLSVVPDLQEVLKIMLRAISCPDVRTLDQCIYIKRRMWRVNNSQHMKSGLYKINLTIDQLRSIGLDEIKELAKKPQYIQVDVPETPIKPLADLFKRSLNILTYEKHRESLRVAKFANASPKEDVGQVTLDTLPRRYQYLSSGACEGGKGADCENVGRNYNLCKLVGCLSKMGCSRQRVLELALDFNNRCRPPKPWPVIEGQVKWLLKGGVS
jgi:hypothetical protein